MWDERYDTEDYVYGTEPNDFLREQVGLIGEAPKHVLCLADGEGRNGVYLAGLGHEVLSVDASAVGLGKARQLARRKDVSLKTLMADLTEHEFPAAAYDAVVS
ncbi:MAG TPA: class I SAM-dependent methyltransferase, partial [Halomonas sp.]|nr:class I SAM-dependent methyltransferase [Halomonas sp.]